MLRSPATDVKKAGATQRNHQSIATSLSLFDATPKRQPALLSENNLDNLCLGRHPAYLKSIDPGMSDFKKYQIPIDEQIVVVFSTCFTALETLTLLPAEAQHIVNYFNRLEPGSAVLQDLDLHASAINVLNKTLLKPEFFVDLQVFLNAHTSEECNKYSAEPEYQRPRP